MSTRSTPRPSPGDKNDGPPDPPSCGRDALEGLKAPRPYVPLADYPRGSPRPRVAMTFRWISLVPPASVLETEPR